MANTIYTPYTYLIRMERIRSMVLPELDLKGIAIQMTFGRLILQVPSMFKNIERLMENQMLLKCDKLSMIVFKQENGKKR